MKAFSPLALGWALLLAAAAVAGCKRSQARPDEISEAQKTYGLVCARCHGPTGAGNGLTPMATAPRNFRDAAFQKERTDDELARVIREGKGGMPPFQNVYTPEQIKALVQVIRGFDPSKAR